MALVPQSLLMHGCSQEAGGPSYTGSVPWITHMTRNSSSHQTKYHYSHYKVPDFRITIVKLICPWSELCSLGCFACLGLPSTVKATVPQMRKWGKNRKAECLETEKDWTFLPLNTSNDKKQWGKGKNVLNQQCYQKLHMRQEQHNAMPDSLANNHPFYFFFLLLLANLDCTTSSIVLAQLKYGSLPSQYIFHLKCCFKITAGIQENLYLPVHIFPTGNRY